MEAACECLIKNPRSFIPVDAKAWCFRHGKPCPILCSIRDLEGVHPISWKHALESDSQLLSDECMAEAKSEAKVEELELERLAETGAKKLELDEGYVELTGMSAGNSCTDYATYGGQKGEAGDTNKAFNVWSGEVLSTRPLFWFSEIGGEGVEVGMYKERLGFAYNIFPIWIEYRDSGSGARRYRFYCFGSCQIRSTFHGTSAEFDLLFKVEPQLVAQDHFVMSNTARKRRDIEMARFRGHVYPADFDGTVPLEHRLTPCQMSRFCDHLDKKLQKKVVL